jgi:hypothetical protein
LAKLSDYRIPVYGHKRDEMIGCWRGLHNEKLHNLHYLQNIIQMKMSRRIRWEVHVGCLRAKTIAHRVLTEKPKAKQLLERTRHR